MAPTDGLNPGVTGSREPRGVCTDSEGSRLGQNMSRNLTIFFCSIRGFSPLNISEDISEDSHLHISEKKERKKKSGSSV